MILVSPTHKCPRVYTSWDSGHKNPPSFQGFYGKKPVDGWLRMRSVKERSRGLCVRPRDDVQEHNGERGERETKGQNLAFLLERFLILPSFVQWKRVEMMPACYPGNLDLVLATCGRHTLILVLYLRNKWGQDLHNKSGPIHIPVCAFYARTHVDVLFLITYLWLAPMGTHPFSPFISIYSDW